METGLQICMRFFSFLVVCICMGWKRRYLGISISRSFNLAINSAFPPRIISVPRPAIFVAIVTAPTRPLCATISASLSTFSGFALRTLRRNIFVKIPYPEKIYPIGYHLCFLQTWSQKACVEKKNIFTREEKKIGSKITQATSFLLYLFV